MTLRTKILPAPVAPAALPRAALQRRLDEALQRRLTTVVAGAGFGKSALLAAWAQRHDVAWYTLGAEDAALSTLGPGLVDALRLRVPDLPVDLAATPGSARGPDASADEGARADAFAAALSEALQERLRRPLALVLDDLHALAPEGAAMRAVEALCRQAPAALHVVLAVADRAARSRSTACAVRARSSSSGAPTSPSMPTRCARCSRPSSTATRASSARRCMRSPRAGPRPCASPARRCARWPAAQRGAAVERLRRPGGALFGYLAREVLAQEPPGVRELVRVAAPLERVHPGLCAALGVEGAPDALGSLARRGLFAESRIRSTAGSRRRA